MNVQVVVPGMKQIVISIVMVTVLEKLKMIAAAYVQVEIVVMKLTAIKMIAVFVLVSM